MTTAGPNYAGTATHKTIINAGSQVSGGGSYQSWANASNATGAPDAAFATVAPSFPGSPSDFLVLTNFGFAIPAGQAIVGVLVEIDHKADADVSPIYDFVSITTDTGVTLSVDQPNGNGFSWPTVLGFDPYGSGATTWSIVGGLTAAQVNAVAFGVCIQTNLHAIAGGSTSGITAYIDAVRITITYTDVSASAVSASYNGYTRTSVNNTPWVLNFTGSTGVNKYQLRTANTSGGGTQVATGTATAGANAPTIAYNASGMANGSNTLYLFVSGDAGATWLGGPYTVTILRDDTAPTATTSISTSPSTVPANNPYTVSMVPNDAASTGVGEMGYQIWTGTGGTGTLLTSGPCTNGVAVTTAQISDLTLASGSNTRYIRMRDGANNYTETSFVVTGAAAITVTVSSPTAGGIVSGLPYAVAWSYSGSAQSSYRLVVYASDGVTIVYDSGTIASAVNGAAIPAGTPLVQATTYKLQVTINTVDVPSQLGSSALVSFTASWSPPAAITGLTLTATGSQ